MGSLKLRTASRIGLGVGMSGSPILRKKILTPSAIAASA